MTIEFLFLLRLGELKSDWLKNDMPSIKFRGECRNVLRRCRRKLLLQLKYENEKQEFAKENSFLFSRRKS